MKMKKSRGAFSNLNQSVALTLNKKGLSGGMTSVVVKKTNFKGSLTDSPLIDQGRHRILTEDIQEENEDEESHGTQRPMMEGMWKNKTEALPKNKVAPFPVDQKVDTPSKTKPNSAVASTFEVAKQTSPRTNNLVDGAVDQSKKDNEKA